MTKAFVRGFLILTVGALTTLAFQNCASPNQISPSDLSSNKASRAPTFSIYSSATRFTTSTANTWQYSGESITLTVPAGSNVQYRISMRQMANFASPSGYFVATLSTSPSLVEGVPQGIGSSYQPATAYWTTLNSEGYLNLAPGTYTYYVMVLNGTAGAMTIANAQNDNGNYCSVIAWPL